MQELEFRCLARSPSCAGEAERHERRAFEQLMDEARVAPQRHTTEDGGMIMRRIAVIGLGAMGAPIAGRLLSKGYEVAVWNRSPGRAATLDSSGATVAASPAAAARGADAVIVMVADSLAVRAVTEGERGIAAATMPGTVVVQMSTVSPSSVARLAAALPLGTGLLDAPVLGSVAEASSGTLRILAGGPRPLAERCAALLGNLGEMLYLGELGAGTAAKLIANNALFGVLGVLGESLALGEALGLSQSALYRALSVTPLAEQASRRRP